MWEELFETGEAIRKRGWITEAEACERTGLTVEEMWDRDLIEGQEWDTEGRLWVELRVSGIGFRGETAVGRQQTGGGRRTTEYEHDYDHEHEGNGEWMTQGEALAFLGFAGIRFTGICGTGRSGGRRANDVAIVSQDGSERMTSQS